MPYGATSNDFHPPSPPHAPHPPAVLINDASGNRYLERPCGVKLFYTDTGGAGDVILFTHGFSSGSKMWDGQVADLSRDYRCVTWDMRGHAASDSPDDASLYNKQHQVQCPRLWCNHLRLTSPSPGR